MANSALRMDTTFNFCKRVGFYQDRPPIVDTISPHFGPLTGGTEVLITGRFFVNVKSVHFGVTAATVLRHVRRDSDPQDVSTVAVQSPESVQLQSVDVIVTCSRSGICIPRFTYTHEQTTSLRKNVQVHSRRGTMFFRAVHAVVRVIMNGDGQVIDAEIVPDDQFKWYEEVMRDVIEYQFKTGKPLVKSVHVDDSRKLTLK